MLVKAIYTWRLIGFSPSFYAKMHLLTFDLVQIQKKVKSGGTAPKVDEPLINNS